MSTRVLVVEESPTQATQIRFLLEDAGFEVETARDGVEGLARIGRAAPEVVVADLVMAGMNGLELVEALRARHPAVPIVLIAAVGGEEIAARALQEGAASYVPGRNLEAQIGPAVRKVLDAASTGRSQHRVQECWAGSESRFVLENDPTLIPPLIAHLSENLARMRICDPTALIRVKIALGEALTNAIFHGNLEVDSSLRDGDDRPYYALAESRRDERPYRDRRVHVVERETPVQVVYVIRDEGPGFDLSTLPDPQDPGSLERSSGRGLLLIHTFMDEAIHNSRGNEITLVKRRDR